MVITLVTRLQHRRFGEKKGEHWKKWQKSFLTFCSFPTRPPPVFIHFFFAPSFLDGRIHVLVNVCEHQPGSHWKKTTFPLVAIGLNGRTV